MPVSRMGLNLRVIWQKGIEYEIVLLSHTSLLFIREEKQLLHYEECNKNY